MSYTLAAESLDGIASSWQELRHSLDWGPIFVLPAWLQVWWEAFGGDSQPYLRTMRHDGKTIAFAPLLVRNKTASFIGSADVCDYLDFVVVPGREEDFFGLLLDDLKENGIESLNLGPLRPDSTVLTHLVHLARSRGHEIVCRPDDVCLELDLPATWEQYLSLLKNKQRHEVRRKLRRLRKAGDVEHRCAEVGDGVEGYLDIFLQLFSISGDEKAGFMNSRMESFFRSLARAMSQIGLLRLGVLELDRIPIAMTMGFVYNGSHYLYNSGYDPRFSHLSAGLLCKALCLKDSIESGVKTWSFLKGAETYKYQLGGREVPLYGCHITMA